MTETRPAPVVASVAGSRIGLELALHPQDEPAFWRAPPVLALLAGRPVLGRRLAIAVLDGPDAELARTGRQLVRLELGRTARWRLERQPGGWPPPGAGEILAAAPTLHALGCALPERLTEVARFSGTQRRLARPGDPGLSCLGTQSGRLGAAEAERAVCRVLLEGAPREVFAFAHAVAACVRLSVAGAGLLAPAPAEDHAPPVLSAEWSLDDALAELVAGLTQALLHWAPCVAVAAGPEPVHQMRVALRRLRSALRLFGPALPRCAELDAVEQPLRTLSRVLGGARDWDVFLGGLGAAVAAAFPAERAVARLLREAGAERDAAYGRLRAQLEAAAYRQLGLRLAELAVARPWRAAAAAAGAEPRSLPDYARHALRRRLRKALRAGEAIEAQPVEALHALRLQCKRLRYAAEFMAPLFPDTSARRFVRRLAAVQDRLGRLNDGVVAAALMRALGGGAGRAFAAGLVQGYVAARTARAREKAERSWRRFRHCPRFWE